MVEFVRDGVESRAVCAGSGLASRAAPIKLSSDARAATRSPSAVRRSSSPLPPQSFWGSFRWRNFICDSRHTARRVSIAFMRSITGLRLGSGRGRADAAGSCVPTTPYPTSPSITAARPNRATNGLGPPGNSTGKQGGGGSGPGSGIAGVIPVCPSPGGVGRTATGTAWVKGASHIVGQGRTRALLGAIASGLARGEKRD